MRCFRLFINDGLAEVNPRFSSYSDSDVISAISQVLL